LGNQVKSEAQHEPAVEIRHSTSVSTKPLGPVRHQAHGALLFLDDHADFDPHTACSITALATGNRLPFSSNNTTPLCVIDSTTPDQSPTWTFDPIHTNGFCESDMFLPTVILHLSCMRTLPVRHSPSAPSLGFVLPRTQPARYI